jgi:predicted RNA-binding Zn-ribbon protein involved in translation (DUF1610 family)
MPGMEFTVPDPGGAAFPKLDAYAKQALGGDVAGAMRAAAGEKPDPFSEKVLTEAFKSFKRECDDSRVTFERVWWRNLLYYFGRQWIVYRADRGWVDKRLHKFVPKPVTNKIQEAVESIAAVFGSVQNAVTVRPEGNDPLDLITADTANRLAPAIHLGHRMNQGMAISDFWLTLTGNSFLQLWFDRDGGDGQIVVKLERCDACDQVASQIEVQKAGHKCPSCGNATMLPTDQTRKLRTGRGRTDVCSPFEIGFKNSYTQFEDIDGLYRKRWRTRSWCERYLPVETVARITWEKASDDRGMQMLRGIQTASDIETGAMAALGGASTDQGEGVTEYTWWLKPNREYEGGLVARFYGEDVLLTDPAQGSPGPLPYKTPKGDPLWPFVHIPYRRVAGRILAISPLDSAIQKQDQLNQLDSMVQMMLQRTSNPVWLEPKGSEIQKYSGEPGIVLKYNPILGNAALKPERIEGANVPGAIFKIRADLLNDIENLLGTYDIIKGQKPTGVEAFSALQLLVERSQSRFGPVMAARGEGYREWFELALELERCYGPDERTWAVLSPNNRWTHQVFKRTELQGSIRIIVEDGSQSPKTNLGKRAAVEQLSNLGVINPKNPDTAYRILQVFGETDLWPGLDASVQSALNEQHDFETWAREVAFMPVSQPAIDPASGMPAVDAAGMPVMESLMAPSSMPPGQREAWHDDDIHLAQHKKWANSDTVRQLLKEKPELRDYIAWFVMQHEQAMFTKAIRDQAMAVGAPHPAGQTPAGQAMRATNRESGNVADVPSGNSEAIQGQGPQ